MLGYLLAVLGLAVLCGAWVVVQRWVARRDPGAPTVESRSGCRHDAGPHCSWCRCLHRRNPASGL